MKFIRSLFCLGFAACILVLVSCASLSVERSSELKPGTILIMPPTNAVQGGQPHPRAKDSGSYLAESLEEQINQATPFQANISQASGFSNEAPVEPDEAQAVAREGDYDYFFLLELGEFRDAAPTTYRDDISVRDDYVTLEFASLYRSHDQKVVWKLTEAARITGPNPQSYYRLLDQLAHMVAEELKPPEADKPTNTRDSTQETTSKE